MQRVEATAAPAFLHDVHAAFDALWREAPDVPDDARDRFRLAVAELVANVVEHGRTASGAAPRIVLELTAAPGRLTAVLQDDAEPPPPPPSGPPPELAESGRGLRMADAAADAITHERDGDGNRWRIEVTAPG
jgi:serine/threonine-protein kinase RsbW